jgi:N-acetylmuramoyl-L-alanine amidase
MARNIKRRRSVRRGTAATLTAGALPSAWTFLVQRLREERREGEGFNRTIGSYQVLHNGVPVPGLSGATVERQGPGDNGEIGHAEHRCIAAGDYPINSHATAKYKTVGYKTSGRRPRPALEIGDTDKRSGILIHPADGYASTIGCINLASQLNDADADIEFSDSFRRVVDVIDDLTHFSGASLPQADGVPIANAHLVVRDAGAVRAAVAAAAAPPQPELAAARIIDSDVVIQAGHEGTPDGMTGGKGPLGNEIDWTPIVANEAVRLLREAGVNAVKETARIKLTRQRYRCKLALFLHFDDPGVPTESGPSVGYSHPSDAPAAEEWKTLYKEFFPFNETWHRDNYTRDEHHYYGFKFTATSDAEFLIEFGDLHSLRQARWLKPRLTWLGGLVAHYVSRRIGIGNITKPAPFEPATPALAVIDGAQPVGASTPFETRPSPSGNKNGHSLTSGLRGTKQEYSDGTSVIEATEALRADRLGGWHGTLTAFQRRFEKDGVITIEQRNYSYRNRQLPTAVAWRQLAAFPAVPDGFSATDIRNVAASQFGKEDHEDEGTGSPIMGLIQTNSEVFGVSLKASVLARVFGPGWRMNATRLDALIEVLFRHRLVRVPLVDVGPHEDTPRRRYPEVDLTWACDQFLNTRGQANIEYRVLLPV